MDLWLILFLSAFSAIIGGISVFVSLYTLFLKDKDKLIQLTNEKVTEEIISLKTSIRFIYSIGPIIMICITVLGIKGLEDLEKLIDLEKVQKINEEYEVRNKEYEVRNQETKKLLKELKTYEDILEIGKAVTTNKSQIDMLRQRQSEIIFRLGSRTMYP